MNNKTIEELENDFWGEPEFDSYVVRSAHELRKKPITDFTIENLRVMIGQQIGLKHLIPVALNKLKHNPLEEGDFYEGDLLSSVLRVSPKFWENNEDWKKQVMQILETIPSVPEELQNDVKTWKRN